MARLVAAFGSSHSVMLVAEKEDWIEKFRVTDTRLPLYDKAGATLNYETMTREAPNSAHEFVTPALMEKRYDDTFSAIATLRKQLETTDLDVLVIIGDDQHELFRDTLMPPLGIYYGETIRNAALPEAIPDDWYRRAQLRRREPEGEIQYPVHAKLAMHFIEGLGERDFDVTALKGLTGDQFEGHAYSYIHRTYLQKKKDLPIVPIFLNTYYPPNPVTPRRCVALGQALAELIKSYPEDLRVGILASGGLSHFVVDEELDRGVIDALKRKDLDYLAKIDPKRLQAGSSEIRQWIAVGAAAVSLDVNWVEYVPAYRTPAMTGTGLAFMRWE